MKSILFTRFLASSILLLLSFEAFADLPTQMNLIIGDWDFPSSRIVFRVRKFSETAVKVYGCERSRYFENGSRFCSYDGSTGLRIHTYRPELDAFFAPKLERKYCSQSLQVSSIYPEEMLRVIDPFFGDGNCSESGAADEGRKI